MLEIRQLEKSFGSHKVLNNINLTVNTQDVAVIVGPSGAGKTTLLRCANFLERATSGTIKFNGVDFDLRSAKKSQIIKYRMETAFVFQNFNLFLNKTALENITEGLIVARKIPKNEANEIGYEMLKKVGLSNYASYYPAQLSGGQQQRVAIARALAQKPKIIFFDEPTSALDPELTEEVLSVIKVLANEGMTMLIITHQLDFARSISNKMIFMEEGQIVESGLTEELFTNPKHERTKQFLKNIRSEV